MLLDIHLIELQERGIMPNGDHLRNTGLGRKLGIENVYMDHRALAFLRAWPDVPAVLRPVYSRFYDAGLIWVDDNAPQDQSWPGQLRLTALGHRIREVMIGKSINFFLIVDVFGLIDDEELARPTKKTLNYAKLFKMEWEDPNLRKYINARLNGEEGEDSLKKALVRLGKAMERATFHTRMAAYRVDRATGELTDDDIPF